MRTRFQRGGAAAHAAAAPPRARTVFAARSSALCHRFGILAVSALTLVSAACNLLDDDQELPNVARVDITGTAPVDLELVVSDNFQRVSDFRAGREIQRAGARGHFVCAARLLQGIRHPGHSPLLRTPDESFVRSSRASMLSVAFDGEIGYAQRANISEGGALEFSEIFFGT